MVIAVLALLGVDLAVLVVFLVLILARKRWVDRQPGAFNGAIRLAHGELGSIAPTWRRGYGRWVRDVFVWTKAPFLFRNELLPGDSVEERRTAAPGAVNRLGDDPAVIRLKVGGAVVEVAARPEYTEHVLGPFA
jgi:Protein of unknown function (DUF2550)